MCSYCPNDQQYCPQSVLTHDHVTGCQQGPLLGCSKVLPVPSEKFVTSEQHSHSTFALGRLPWQADSAPNSQPGTMQGRRWPCVRVSVLTSSTTTLNLLFVLRTGFTPESHCTLENTLDGPMRTCPG